MNPLQIPAMIELFIGTIQAFEKLLPDSPGKEKFDSVIKVVEQVFGSTSTMLPVLVSMATLLVNGFRATGAFSTKPAA